MVVCQVSCFLIRDVSFPQRDLFFRLLITETLSDSLTRLESLFLQLKATEHIYIIYGIHVL